MSNHKRSEGIAQAVTYLEAEKSLAGLGSSDASDSGVTARFISSLLYYLEEKKTQSFIAMTANDISKLPPELLRPGRLDSLWFVDLPSDEERESVLAIQLRKVGRDPKKFDLGKIVKETDGFTGAELMNCIKEAMFIGFNDSSREFNTDDIITAAGNIVPMIKTKEAVIGRLREWGAHNARSANGPTTKTKAVRSNPLWTTADKGKKEKSA